MPEEKKTSANIEKIIEQIEKLTVLELSELVKALEDKFGVAAVAAAPAAGATQAADQTQEADSSKSEFDVVLAQSGANKIAVIKAVRELNQTLGLKEAKDLVESAPKTVLESAGKEAAAEAKKKLEEAGATVELK